MMMWRMRFHKCVMATSLLWLIVVLQVLSGLMWGFGASCSSIGIVTAFTSSPNLSREQQRRQRRQQSEVTPPTSIGLATRCYQKTALFSSSSQDEFQHTLAILTMPTTSTDRIANEAILNEAVQRTRKLSVVLRTSDSNHGKDPPSLALLRQYVGEVYSTLWDVAMGSNPAEQENSEFCDVVVYPQNLPNAPPEQWIHHAPDLDSVCSHDSICGWISSEASGRGKQYQERQGQGMGGLEAHVQALNADRKQRDLPPVQVVPVSPWPMGASASDQAENLVSWLDDNENKNDNRVDSNSNNKVKDSARQLNNENDAKAVHRSASAELMGGARVPSGCLYNKVAVGGTFDGMHYGHRKLLTLAVSSVDPTHGQLIVGVTVDGMLQKKAYSEEIPLLEERIEGARDFLYRLAPGIKNRVRLVPIADEYGPPGSIDEGSGFDALVLSHETLENGCKLNQHRVEALGIKPLALLCTRRTEPHGMSSTALRRRRSEQKQLTAK